MLSDVAVRQAKAADKSYALTDFNGLFLYIATNGTKAWHFRYSWAGKRERISFGTYPALSLKEARDLRDEARALLARDINPHTERKRKRHAIVLAGKSQTVFARARVSLDAANAAPVSGLDVLNQDAIR